MANITIGELQTHGDAVVNRAARGEAITITRLGQPVAELRPLKPPLSAQALLRRWRHLPPVDPKNLRADLDE